MPAENESNMPNKEAISDAADFLKTTDDHVKRAHDARGTKILSEEFVTLLEGASLFELRRLYHSNGLNTGEFYAVIRQITAELLKQKATVSAA